MAARCSQTTEEYLRQVPLPPITGKYVIISHEHIIDTAMELLTDQGLFVEKALYKTGKGGDIAIGKYYIKDEQDPEMQMMFAWGNSYNKQMTFKCAIGASLFVCENGMVAGDMGSYGRKHMGTALEECTATMKHQITNATRYYSQLIEDKKNMKDVMVSERVRAEILGRLLFEHDALTLEQMGVIKSELKKPTHDYNADKNSLWTMYNHITFGLKKAHPRYWMDQQKQIHWFLCNEFGIGINVYAKGSTVIPVMAIPAPIDLSEATLTDVPEIPEVPEVPIVTNQIDLLDSIAEVEAEMGLNNITDPEMEESPFKDDPSIEEVDQMNNPPEDEISFEL